MQLLVNQFHLEKIWFYIFQCDVNIEKLFDGINIGQSVVGGAYGAEFTAT